MNAEIPPRWFFYSAPRAVAALPLLSRQKIARIFSGELSLQEIYKDTNFHIWGFLNSGIILKRRTPKASTPGSEPPVTLLAPMLPPADAWGCQTPQESLQDRCQDTQTKESNLEETEPTGGGGNFKNITLNILREIREMLNPWNKMII